MTTVRTSTRKKKKSAATGSAARTTIKGPKDGIVLELDEGDVALIINDKESRLYLPANLGDNDPVPEHMQLVVAMAVLFKNDPPFRKYIKKRWSMILQEVDEDPELQKELKKTKPRKKVVKRRKSI
jgi:hypothetical protein